MNIYKTEIVETSLVERMCLNDTLAICENIIEEASDPETVHSAKLALEGLTGLLSHIITKY